MNKILMIGLALAGWAHAASADVNLAGNFRGKVVQNGATVDLLMRSLSGEGRDGSYLGLMIQSQPLKVAIYMIDKDDDGGYVMVPREVTGDGEVVGVKNPDPSLALAVTDSSGKRPSFTIGSAHSSNQDGFQGPMNFKGSDSSNIEWSDLKQGTYEAGRGSVSIPNELVDRQAPLIPSLPDLDGPYIIREKLTGVYTLYAVSKTAAGDPLEKYPHKLALFIHQSGFFGGGDFFLLVNPNDYSDVTRIRRK